MKRVLSVVSEEQINVIIEKSQKSIITKSYASHIQDLIDFKSQSVDSINPCFEDDFDDMNPAANVEIMNQQQYELMPPSIDEDTGVIEPGIVTIEQFPEIESSDTEPVVSQNIISRRQVPKRRHVSIKKKRASRKPSEDTESENDSDSEFMDSHQPDHPAKRHRPTQQPTSNNFPVSVSACEAPAIALNSSHRSHQSKDPVVDQQPHFDSIDSSDTDSFLNQLGSSHPDQHGFIRFGPNLPINNRRCVLPARPSCTSCADAFGDSDCCFKFCPKCCKRWAKHHKNHSCLFHGVGIDTDQRVNS
jgi:hypothetical protein